MIEGTKKWAISKMLEGCEVEVLGYSGTLSIDDTGTIIVTEGNVKISRYKFNDFPKEGWSVVRKKCKVAPCLFRCFDGLYIISTFMFKSEEQAKEHMKNCGHEYIKWLIGTGYEVEIDAD